MIFTDYFEKKGKESCDGCFEKSGKNGWIFTSDFEKIGIEDFIPIISKKLG